MGSWSTINPRTRNNRKKMTEVLDMIQWPDGEWGRYRPVGPTHSYAFHWFETISDQGKKSRFPKQCLDYNPKTEKFDRNTKKVKVNGKTKTKVVKLCPYCKGTGKEPPITYVSNFIDREAQENEPRKKKPPLPEEKKKKDLLGYPCFLKKPGSKTYTPVVAGNAPSTLASKLKGLVALNKHTIKDKVVTKDLSDPKYGMDINIKYDSTANGPAKYDAQKEEKTKLTDEEMCYLLQDLTVIDTLVETPEEAQEEWNRIQPRLVESEDDKKKKKKSKHDDDNEDEDNDDQNQENENNDDEDDEPKKKKSKKVTKKKAKKRSDDNENQDDDEPPFDLDSLDDIDLENDDEDEKPKKKKKK